MSTSAYPDRFFLDGADGNTIECFYASQTGPPRGLAVVAHPHPLLGGTADNKVVTTLARSLHRLGYATFRPNFRGAGASDGTHDQGTAETDDLHVVLDHARHLLGRQLPIVLAGFSFGAYVTTRLAKRLAAQGTPAQRLILVGTAAGHVEGARHYETEAVPPDTLVIHGSADDVVPLANVLAWAEPLHLAVQVIPGADHFFHRKLALIRQVVEQAWH